MFTFPIDKWVGGIKYEHGHRLFASIVGLLTVILTIGIVFNDKRPWVKWLSFFALGAVIIQGILGGLTVLFLLPTAISVAHGMLAQSFFCAVSAIALFTSRWWREDCEAVDIPGTASIQKLSIIAVVVVFLQLAFGALMRHTFSGLSVPDFPLAYGHIFPSISNEAISAYNQELFHEGIKWSGDKPVAAYQIIIHLLHRYWAFIVGGIVTFLGYKLWSMKSLPRKLQKTGILLLSIVIVQFLLGIFTVLSRKEYIITSIHVVIGALVLVTCVLTALTIARLRWNNKFSS
jgi:cytochrome c oxidase assembly protein subunit 15